LHIALRFRWAALGLAVAFFLCSFPIGRYFIGWEFVPDADEGEFNIRVEAPIGTSVSGTESVLAEIDRIKKKGEKELA